MQMFFDYLRTHDLTKVAPGRIVLEGDRLFLNVADSKKQPREERKLEAHRKYIDIQVPLTANETVGWRPLESLDMAPDIAYDEQRDIVFYRQPSSAYIPVEPGQFYLMLPNDAHAPLIGEDQSERSLASCEWNRRHEPGQDCCPILKLFEKL